MAELPKKPITRQEEYLNAIATGDPSGLPDPITREEIYLDYIAQNGGGGGGGGGTTNYDSLTNKPKINGTELRGNKTTAQLGLQSLLSWDNAPTSGSSNAVRSSGIFNALAEKVDKEAGKGLSSNDFTTAEKTKLAGIAAGAEMNIIGGITLNGEPLVPVNKIIALNVITKAVNDLQNYYLKTETYNKSEVDALINNISSLTLDIVEELPTTDISTTTIYLVPVSGATNVYMQHAYINGAWAQLGTTQVDLTNYYTKAQVDALLAAKQDVLTFDSAPTSLSENPVTSGGVYSALASKQDALTFDNAPTENSNNPVKSGGVYDALADKQDALTFDTEPTAGSTNPVTSGGVASALQNVDVPVATEERAGKVKPDGTTVTIDDDGTLHAAAGVEFDERDFVEDSGTVALVDSQRIFTGTQAEWDALSTAVKKTYGQVNITDDESGTPEYYSTTETKTNKVWVDGKPIYRKVVITGAASSDTTFPTGLPDSVSDYWIDFGHSYFIPNDNNSRIPINYPHPTSGVSASAWLRDKNTIQLRLGEMQSVSKMVVTLEYTKEG